MARRTVGRRFNAERDSPSVMSMVSSSDISSAACAINSRSHAQASGLLLSRDDPGI
jgi:hypothetical protein